VDTYYEIVKKFRSAFGDSTLSTDIISGYPGDDEESHEKTLRLIEVSRPDIINITRFSARPYTADYSSSPPPSNLVKRWTKDYLDLHRKITSENLEKRIGKTEKILITESGKDGTVVGRDSAYRPVVLKSALKMFSRVDVEIVSTGQTYLVGKLC
jgi:threonylcarbamoyladenosine tRNA methylthiotransferase CDKAL1